MNTSDKKLILTTILSTLAYILLWVTFELISLDTTNEFNEAWIWVLYCFHVIPSISLQLLVCRRAKGIKKGIPFIVLSILAIIFTVGAIKSSGWEILLWLLLLFLCAAPAIGFIIAFAIYLIPIWYKKHHGNINK